MEREEFKVLDHTDGGDPAGGEEWHGGSEYDDTDDNEYRSCSEDPGQHDDDDSDDSYADGSDGSDGSDGGDGDTDGDGDGSHAVCLFFHIERFFCINLHRALLPCCVSTSSFKF